MKEKIEILYLCDFDINKKSGKDRATRQKTAALKELVSKFYLVSGSSGGVLFRLWLLFYLDIKTFFLLLIKRPRWLISRGYSGFFSQKLCRLMGILTVREIHADALDELDLIPFSGFKKKVLHFLALLSRKIDVSADVRIFNHPDLLENFKSRGLCQKGDFWVYNGGSVNAKSSLTKKEAREKFGLPDDYKVLVFVGSASEWHGVEYLVEIQKLFSLNNDRIMIVFGGGCIDRYNEDRLCLNFSPLSDVDSADLIAAADACCLPVKNNRVSPGSPLKLYDYIANKKYIFAQELTNGYSDEVERYGIGFSIDFTSPLLAREAIIEMLKKGFPAGYPRCQTEWKDRMLQWIDGVLCAEKEMK